MRTRRIGGLLALTLATAIAVGTTVAAATTTTATLKTATVQGLGTVLVSGNGHTLYRFTSDKKGSSSCTGGCATVWPPLLVTGAAKPTAGKGVTSSKLGTIKRANGQLQVSYGGYALYRYSGDTKAGEAKGEGVEKSWYALAASGTLVKTATATAATSSTPTTSSPPVTATTPASTTGGYDY